MFGGATKPNTGNQPWRRRRVTTRDSDQPGDQEILAENHGGWPWELRALGLGCLGSRVEISWVSAIGQPLNSVWHLGMTGLRILWISTATSLWEPFGAQTWLGWGPNKSQSQAIEPLSVIRRSSYSSLRGSTDGHPTVAGVPVGSSAGLAAG